MFLKHYNLREQPFGVTPDPRFLLDTPSHREAWATLLYGIETGRGFLGLVAPPGLGKTTLLFRLMEHLHGRTRTAFLFQTQCDSDEFLSALLADLDEEDDGSATVPERSKSPPKSDWQTLCDTALTAMNADGAVALVYRGTTLVSVASVGTAPPVGSTAPLDSGLTSECFHSGHTIYCADTEHDYRVQNKNLPYRSFLITPISRDGKVIGLLELFSARRSAFGRKERETFTSVWSQMSTQETAAPVRSNPVPLHGPERVKMHNALHAILLREAERGKPPVVIVDEAQNLSEPVLETIRLLSDFETSSTKLLQVILAGQTQLRDRLASPGLVQLRQRVSTMSLLAPLNRSEVHQYIEHRLRVAGYRGGSIFTPAACDFIADLSMGIPRNVNNICFQSMSLAFATGLKTIDNNIIQEVARDLEWRSPSELPATTAANPIQAEYIAAPLEDATSIEPGSGNQPAQAASSSEVLENAHESSRCQSKEENLRFRVPLTGTVIAACALTVIGSAFVWHHEIPGARSRSTVVTRSTTNKETPYGTSATLPIAPQHPSRSNVAVRSRTGRNLPQADRPMTNSAEHGTSASGESSKNAGFVSNPTQVNSALEQANPNSSGRSSASVGYQSQQTIGSVRETLLLPNQVPATAAQSSSTKDQLSRVIPLVPTVDTNSMSTPNSDGTPVSAVTTSEAKPTASSSLTGPNFIQGALVKMVSPDYPGFARTAHIEGDVVLNATVSKDGRVRQVQVVSGNSVLAGAAIRAVKKWRYAATLVDGEPQAVQKQIVVKFSLAALK